MVKQFTETIIGKGPIPFEGRESHNPFAFHWYDAQAEVGGKKMADHFRFAVAYWHSFGGAGSDPFGGPSRSFPWNSLTDPLSRAKAKMDAAFAFMERLGSPYYCFHDFDLVSEAQSLAETEKRLRLIVDFAKEKQKETGIQLLWGTANLFSHPRYINGAATNPDFAVVARAAAQVKLALDMTIELGGKNYVFWGGREGYSSLLNTKMKKEREHLGLFLKAARDYGRQAGFTGAFLVEPKPMEPTKHQYDFDVSTVIGFLREFDLDQDFKLNVEVNHATLAGHTFAHELQTAVDAHMLGSMDANRGDYQNGWDTDQFPVNVYELTEAMLVFLEAGGLETGGVNFDAKLRRESIDPDDLLLAHIAGMDNFARALVIAQRILDESDYLHRREQRYASFNSGPGRQFAQGKLDLKALAAAAEEKKDLGKVSGKQEYFEQLINLYL